MSDFLQEPMCIVQYCAFRPFQIGQASSLVPMPIAWPPITLGLSHAMRGAAFKMGRQELEVDKKPHDIVGATQDSIPCHATTIRRALLT